MEYEEILMKLKEASNPKNADSEGGCSFGRGAGVKAPATRNALEKYIIYPRDARDQLCGNLDERNFVLFFKLSTIASICF